MILLRRRKIYAEDITYFLGELSILLTAGLSLKEAVDFAKHGQMSPLLANFMDSVQKSVQKGLGLTAALAAYPQYVPPFLVELLGQAEREQHLHTTLAEIARFRAANDKTNINMGERSKETMAGPLTLLGSAAVMVAGMMIFVMPQFKLLFDSFGAELPAFTMLLINMSSVIQAWWWVVLALVLVLVFIPVHRDVRTKKLIRVLDYLRTWLTFNLPGIGNINHALEIIRCLRTWEFMLARNASVEKTLDAAASVVDSTLYADALYQLRTAVTSGIPLAEALGQQKLLPSKVGQALLIATRGRGSNELLAKMADLYTHQAQLRFERNSRFFTLFLKLIVGLIIGTIVIAMYLPIFQMAQAV